MVVFLRRRLISSAIALLGVTIVVFFLARLTGSPALVYLPQGASAEAVADFNAANGYDRPLVEQFLSFLWGIPQFDFGESLWQQRPAATVVLESMPQTLLLALIAMSLSLVVSVGLGTLAALHAFRPTDKAISFVSLGLASIPEFWFALVAILLVAVNLGLVPTSGQSDASSWVLPVATLLLSPVGVLTQVVRAGMIDAMHSGYVQNARARGYSRWRLALRHALRNALLPIITVAGDKAAGMVNGVIIVSTVFAWPGVGAVLVRAVLNRDFAVIQAGVFVIGVAVILLNVLVDALYAVADPRIRVS
jgi:peptide/nickel transport system permease protein